MDLTDTKGEAAAKKILEAWGYMAHRMRRPAEARYKANVPRDLWRAIDVAGVHPHDGFRFVQVGDPESVSQKRRAIEAVPWPDRADVRRVVVVELWEVRKTDCLEDGRRVHDFFRLHRFDWTGVAAPWQVHMAVSVSDRACEVSCIDEALRASPSVRWVDLA